MKIYTTLKSLFQHKTFLLLLVAGLFCLNPTLTSCGSNKTGCPVNERAAAKTNRKGELSNKKGRTNLFPKKVRKKMRTK